MQGSNILSCILTMMVVVNGAITSSNIFKTNTNYFVSPDYQSNLRSTISHTTVPSTVTYLNSMMNISSAFWVDSKARIVDLGVFLQEAQQFQPSKQLVTIVIYNLPNRDCASPATTGDICCHYNVSDHMSCAYPSTASSCTEGISEYSASFIDLLFTTLSQYHTTLDMAIIVEPYALASIATHLSDPRCGSTDTLSAYKSGITYAVNKLKPLNVAIYLDAAHGGWLGSHDSLSEYLDIIATLDIDMASIRGFATNVGSLQDLGIMCPWNSTDGVTNNYCAFNKGAACCDDPCNLASEKNQANNELNYVSLLSHLVSSKKTLGDSFAPHFIIDTSRNGAVNSRSNCAHWCNIRNAGVGLFPTSSVPNSDLVDAYLWIQSIGTSDGCTLVLPEGEPCPQYDPECGSVDSIGSLSTDPRAPLRGVWFDFAMIQLATNGMKQPTSSMVGREAMKPIRRLPKIIKRSDLYQIQ